METVSDFILGGSKITADGDCSHEIKRCLLLGSKALTDIDSILKSRGITLPIKFGLVKAMVFLVVTCGCESWTIQKVECQKLMLLNCGVGEDSWESLGQQGDQTSPSKRNSVLNIRWKDWCSSWNSNILATWWEEPTIFCFCSLKHKKQKLITARPWIWVLIIFQTKNTFQKFGTNGIDFG